MLEIVFPALRINLQMFQAITRGNQILQTIVKRESKGILPASILFVRSLQTSKSLFFLILIVGEKVRPQGSTKKEVQQVLVDQYYLVILYTSWTSLAELSQLAQYCVLALQIVRYRLQADLAVKLSWFSWTIVLQSSFHYSWPVLQPREHFADLQYT